MGKLRDQIFNKAGARSSVGNSPICALRQSCSQCRNDGYVLSAQGAVIQAALCDCVKNCEVCFGAMMLTTAGQTKPCANPSPRRIVSLFNESGLPARYIDAELKSFSNFSGNGREQMQRLQKWLQLYMQQGMPGVILSGPVGVGKTYLLAAIAKHLLRHGYGVKFIDFHRLLSVIRSGYAEKKSEEEILAPLIDAEVLIIDELGKGRNNDWEQEKLDQIVMGRYNQNKAIIASTNYLLRSDANPQNFFNARLDEPAPYRNSFNPDVFDSLETRVGKRIFSRLYETTIFIELNGHDMRKKLHPEYGNERPLA